MCGNAMQQGKISPKPHFKNEATMDNWDGKLSYDVFSKCSGRLQQANQAITL